MGEIRGANTSDVVFDINCNYLFAISRLLVVSDMIRRFIWMVIGWVYVHIAKPVLFLTSPDNAHARVIKVYGFLGKSSAFRWLVRTVFKPRSNKRITQIVGGVKFVNPVGLSAGFDKNGEIVPIVSNLGFGFGEVGSVTADYCVGNEKPWFYRLPKTKSLVVNVGLANHGSKTILRRLLKNGTKIRKNYPVILSVAKANSPNVVTVQQGIKDYITTIERAGKSKLVKMIEINISCPNTFGGEPFTEANDLSLLLKTVDKLNIKQPVFVKMPSNLTWPKAKELLDVITEHKIAGVTVANLMKDRSVVSKEDRFPKDVSGSLSGMPAKAISDDLIRNTYKEYGSKLIIIGVGGIFSADDAYRKIRLGASLVELITGMIFEGPQLASQINDGIARNLKRDGFTHISQAIGVDASIV